MGKIIKEIIIMLLICLVGILLFAVIFYRYIPNRKIVAEVAEYKASDEVEQLLQDSVDQDDNEVVLTYSVTSSDLSNYEATNNYNPGKANPFSPATTTSKEKTTTSTGSGNDSSNSSNSAKDSTNSGGSNNSDSSDSSSDSSSSRDSNSNSSYISENGTK